MHKQRLSTEKSAQEMLDMLRGAGKTVGQYAGNATDAVKRWYGSMSPDARNALLRGVAGAAIGGGITGGISAFTPRDRESRRGVLGPALMGAMLGGGAAAGLPYGAKLLTSGVQFKSEEPRRLGARALDIPAGSVLSNPATYGLGGYAAYKARPGIWAGLQVGRVNAGPWVSPAAGNEFGAARNYMSGAGRRFQTAGQQIRINPSMSRFMGRQGLQFVGAGASAAGRGAFAGAGSASKTLVNVLKNMRGRGALASIPIAMLVGSQIDKVIRGE